MILLGTLILAFYVLILVYLLIGFYKINEINNSPNPSLNHCFSIIIPFRNEAENLEELLTSIEKINYPTNSFEVLLINDESTDDSVSRIEDSIKNSPVSFKILNNRRTSASPKKDAITWAIEHALHPWIVTTDADCILPYNWLHAYNQFIIEHDPFMIVAPVSYLRKKGIVNQFQITENFSLQTTTAGGFGQKLALLCNGANLAYKKSIFKEVNGYSKNNTIASGDDIFLLETIKKRYPDKIGYLKSKEAIVKTKAQDSWKTLIEQRIRWASKNKHQKDWKLLLLGSSILGTNLLIVFLIGLSLLQPNYVGFTLVFILLKLSIDYFYCKASAQFFEEEISIFPFLINWFLYPFISLIVFLKSLKGSYHWKGRAFN